MAKVALSDFLNDWLQKCVKKPRLLQALASEQASIEITNKVGNDTGSKISWYVSNFSKIKVRSYQPPNIIDLLDFHFVIKNLVQTDFIESDLTQNLVVCALDCCDKLGKPIFIKQKCSFAENELYYKKLRVEAYNGLDKDLDNFNFASLSAMNMNKKNFSNYIRILSLCLTNQLFRNKVKGETLFTENIRRLASMLGLNNDFVSNIKLTNGNLSNVLSKKFENQHFKPLVGKICIESYIDSVASKKRDTTEFLNEVLMNGSFLLGFGIVELIALTIEKLEINIEELLFVFIDKHTVGEVERWLPVFRIVEKYLRWNKTVGIDYNELTYLFSGMISDSFHPQLDLELHPISCVFFSSLLEIDIDWNQMIIESEECDREKSNEFFAFYITLAKRFTSSIKLFERVKFEAVIAAKEEALN